MAMILFDPSDGLTPWQIRKLNSNFRELDRRFSSPSASDGTGLPEGGLAGQFLVKRTSENGDAAWETAYTVPAGGSDGMVLVKDGQLDGVTKWQILKGLVPAGGAKGQALVKSSAADWAYQWDDIDALPPGGTAGQALLKNSSTDGDASWGNIPIRPQEQQITTGQVTTSLMRWVGASAQITAPSISEYAFLCWVHSSTVGWAGSTYIENPINSSTNVWCAGGETAQTPGQVLCTALYRRTS